MTVGWSGAATSPHEAGKRNTKIKPEVERGGNGKPVRLPGHPSQHPPPPSTPLEQTGPEALFS